MKRILFILPLLLTILILPVHASSTTITVDIPAKTTLVEDQYHVTVSLEGNTGFASIQLELSYDPDVIQCVEVISGSLVNGMLSVTNPQAEGDSTRAVLVAASVHNVTKNGTLATFVFDKPQSGNPNFSFALTDFCDENSQELDCDIVISNHYEEHAQNQTPTIDPPADEIIILPWWDTTTGTTPAVPEVPTKPVLPSAFQDELMKPGVSFTDVGTSHWAKPYVEEASARGIINGYPDGTFHPDTDMTRAEIYTILWNLSDKPLPSRGSPFADVGKDDWFFNAAGWAHENGYTEEGTNSYFLPNEILNREQVIAILYRYAGLPETSNALQKYEDTHAVSTFALPAMNWAVSVGIIVGMDDTHLVPQGAITRAQITTITVRYIHYIKSLNP